LTCLALDATTDGPVIYPIRFSPNVAIVHEGEQSGDKVAADYGVRAALTMLNRSSALSR
jgi:hypothetical protein